MVYTRNKRKRKHESTEGKKSKRRNNKMQQPGSTKSDSRSVIEKKAKKAKNKNEIEIVPINPVTFKVTKDLKTSVTISAKPKINKSALKISASSRNIKKVNKPKKQEKKTNVIINNQATKKYRTQYLDDNIQVITPLESCEPPLEDISKEDFSLPEIDPSLLVNDFNKEIKPIIIEANLKKPASFYIPSILRDVENEQRVSAKSFKKNKKSKNKTKCDPTIDPPAENSCNTDVPKELEEFYNEITKSVEPNVTNSINNDKAVDNDKLVINDKVKKPSLTVNQSVQDHNNLIDIVHENTVLLENLNASTNQEYLANFFSLENKVILVLLPETQFSFLGKLKLKVLYGAVKLYGCVFDPIKTVKSVEIYSPRGYSSISISVIDSDGTHNKEKLWDSLIAEGVDRSLKTKLHDTIVECKQGWSVLLLENFENTLTTFLNNNSSFKIFPKIDNTEYTWCDPRRAASVLQANFQFNRHNNEISLSPAWNESVTDSLVNRWKATKCLCTMIVGGKNVGKSTTARYLVNTLLQHTEKVILIDLDPGQAEMTPAACVSLSIIEDPLLGPNFTHLKTPFYQLFLEDINVSNCITRYIECAKKVIECLKSREDLSGYPIIVNTMGFCKGLGLDICVFLLKLIQPTNVIQLLSKRPRNNFDFALINKTINDHKTSSIFTGNNEPIMDEVCDYELHYVPTAAEGKRQFECWNMEPRQQREITLLSYLSQIIENAEDKRFCSFMSTSINNIIPYVLPFSSFYVSLSKSSISPTHILAAMNGNIVALCGIDLDDDTSITEKESLNYPLVVIRPPPTACYGYGIVRGIDMKRRCLYVNTPLDKSMLRYVNLLSGCSAVPFSLLQPEAAPTRPYAADRHDLPTSREARRGYFRIDNKNKNST